MGCRVGETRKLGGKPNACKRTVTCLPARLSGARSGRSGRWAIPLSSYQIRDPARGIRVARPTGGRRTALLLRHTHAMYTHTTVTTAALHSSASRCLACDAKRGKRGARSAGRQLALVHHRIPTHRLGPVSSLRRRQLAPTQIWSASNKVLSQTSNKGMSHPSSGRPQGRRHISLHSACHGQGMQQDKAHEEEKRHRRHAGRARLIGSTVAVTAEMIRAW